MTIRPERWMVIEERSAFLNRRHLLTLVDALAWVVSISVVCVLRFEGLRHHLVSTGFIVVISLSVFVQLLVGWFLVYRHRWRVGSFEEFRALAVTVAIASGSVFVVDWFFFRSAVSAASFIGGSATAFVIMVFARGTWRQLQEGQRGEGARAPAAIVFGAGEAGNQIINLLVSDRGRPYWPAALLDDDPLKQNLRVRHLRVSGSRASIAAAARLTGAKALLIAVPSADSDLIRPLTTAAEEAGLEVYALPPVGQLLARQVSVEDIQPVSEVDLLGRRTVDTEISSIAHYLTGRCVLVTGAGGSIGSELCRQILQFGPSNLVMLDRDESGLHQVQLSIEGRAMLDSRSLVVNDIRDAEALNAVFEEHRPEVVFHAAALKHLPLLEMWPAEAHKTNVIGTLNVLEAVARFGVRTFVNISTDKSANPCSVLGYSKRIAERLTSTFAVSTKHRSFLSVRFGNVLGSRGSVLTAFQAQVAGGGPVTVTHPSVTRYFMTTEEAVQLVIQAGAFGGDGDVFVLDMGQPVKIDEVARRLAREATPPVDVVYTGLRPGEKLHEDLFGEDEKVEATDHPLILRSSVDPIDLDDIIGFGVPSDPFEGKLGLQILASAPTMRLRVPARAHAAQLEEIA